MNNDRLSVKDSAIILHNDEIDHGSWNLCCQEKDKKNFKRLSCTITTVKKIKVNWTTACISICYNQYRQR